jgi:putative membrane protein
LKIAVYIAALGGLGLTTLLIAYQGFSVVYEALAVAGWGLVWVALFHLIPMALDTLAWRVLLPSELNPSLNVLVWIRWIREAVDGLLPVAQVGGELVGTRLLMMNAMPGSIAGASVVVDLTLAVLTQLIFTLMGLGLLLANIPNSGVVLGVLVGVGIGTLSFAGFVLVQKRGLFALLVGWLSGLSGGRRWLSLVGGAERLDKEIKAMYRRQRTLLLSAGWQMLAWILGAGEVWLALYFLGHPVTWVEALLLESLGQAIRSAAFAIPGSLGVQEGGYMLLGGLLGLNPETGLALSLAKRVRELLLGIPALLHWQFEEGRRLWSGKTQAEEPVDLGANTKS